MTRSTDAAIARAFYDAMQLSEERAPQYQVAYNYIIDRAAEFDAEAGGTDRQTEEAMQVEAVEHGHPRDPVASAADGKAAAPYTPPDGKVACPIPTCRAELFPGQACGGVNCGLRRAE